MNESKITTRYAKALFKLAQEKNLLDRIKQDLDLIKQAFELKEFKEFLYSPIIPEHTKKQIFADLFKGKVHEYTLQFLFILAENRREQYLNIIIMDYEKLYRKALNITEVQLTTAIELDQDLKQQFIDILKKVTDSKIDLHHSVKPEIIGGFILKIDDRRLDASILTQLNKLRKHISN